MNKTLYLGNSNIKFNPIETNILSIIDRENDFKYWFYNNFIHLISSKDAHWGAFLFGNDVVIDCPWVEGVKLEHRLIDRNIVDFLRDKLNKDIYIWMNIEIIDIPEYEMSGKYHDIFVYGYDDGEKKFYVADYPKDGLYKRFCIEYNLLEKGFENMTKYQDTLGVYLIWKREENYLNKYTSSTYIIKKAIKRYLDSDYPFSYQKYMESNFLQECSYGMKLYEILLGYCYNILNKKDFCLDYRLFDMEYQHKKVMSERLKFLCSQGTQIDHIIIEKADVLCKELLIVRNLFLKYYLSNKEKILLQIIERIKDVQKNEKDVYYKIYELL